MAFPFNKLIQGMMSPRMVRETVDVVMSAIDQGVQGGGFGKPGLFRFLQGFAMTLGSGAGMAGAP